MLNDTMKAGKSLPDLYSYLEQVTDYRNANNYSNHTIYKLADLLLLVILASMSNFNSQNGYADFCKNNKKEILTYLKISSLPSTATFHRLSKQINLLNLSAVLRKWLLRCLKNLNYESNLTASIDGKFLRGQFREHQSNEQNMLAVVSSFCHEFKICLNWVKLDGKKDSETFKFRELLDDPCIKLITGDCMHCNSKTLNLLEDLNKEYVIGLKGNCPKLFKYATEKLQLTNCIDKVDDNTKQFTRVVEIYRFSILEDKTSDFSKCNIQTVIKVTRYKTKHSKKLNRSKSKYRKKVVGKNTLSGQVNFYVSNIQSNNTTHTAKFFAETIRNHWLIENSLHREKDVTLGEDKHKTVHRNSACFFSTILSTIINIFNLNNKVNQTNRSIKKATQAYCNKVDECLQLIGYQV
jgi:predicted transposase YbfD/YdcC